MNNMLLAIFFPIIGAFFIPLAPKKVKSYLAAAVLLVTFLLVLLVIPPYLRRGDLLLSRNFSDWFSFAFLADGLAIFMALVSSLVGFLVAVYSLEYMKDYACVGDFYFWMVLFIGAMMGLVFSANLVLMFCFWEVTSVCSWQLIGFYRKDKDTKAADKAFLVTFFGASLMLAGIILVLLQYGTLDIVSLKGLSLSNLAAFLLLAGVLSKSAQLPLETWLPDAGVAPTPVTALLHAAVLVKIGIYVFARLAGATFILTPQFFNFAIALSVITIIVAASSALAENNIKRILAYSTISQLGYILLAISLNTEISLKVAMLYVLAHSLAKGGLFLCAGIVEHKTGTKDIMQLGGLLKTMPWTACAYLLCAFSVIGIPPFLGFWPKIMVVLLAVESGHLIAGSLMVLGAIFTMLYLLRLFSRVFLGEVRIEAREEKNSPMVLVVVLLGVLSLILGVLFRLPLGLAEALIK